MLATPRSLPDFGRPPIFLSASVPLRERHPMYFTTADPIAIRDAIIALATVVLPATGIVFGGHPAITPLISAVADRLSHVSGRIVLFQSGWFVKTMPAHPGIQHIEIVPEAATRDQSLADMRDAMIRSYPQFGAAVFIGGMEGVEREFESFRQIHPTTDVFPIASTGAAAERILRQQSPPLGGWAPGLTNDLAYLSLFRRLLRI
jgi:hypothetical protein